MKRYELERLSGSLLEPSNLIFALTIAGALYLGAYLIGGALLIVAFGQMLLRIADNGYIQLDSDRIVLRGHVVGTVKFKNLSRAEKDNSEIHQDRSLVDALLGIHVESMKPTVRIEMIRRQVLFTTSGYFFPVLTRHVGLRVAKDQVDSFIEDLIDYQRTSAEV